MRSKVFFKEGKWSIVEHAPSHHYYMSEFSAIRHKCKIFGREHVTHPTITWKTDTPICSLCNEQVPENIMGLWTLHNWDHMQDMKSAEEQWIARPGQIWEYTTSGLMVPQ